MGLAGGEFLDSPYDHERSNLTHDVQNKKKKGKKTKSEPAASSAGDAAPSATTTSAEPASTPSSTAVKRDLTARVEEVEE
jgi:hypothetical protein